MVIITIWYLKLFYPVNPMRITLLLFVLALSLSSCGSGRQMSATEPPLTVSEPVAEEPEQEPEPAEVIPVLEESFTFESREDEKPREVNRFFVILGSFRISDNANRFKASLEEEGFDPVILLSETGLNRVSVDSYNSETDARQSVLDIRRSFPEYNDAWLLIRRGN
jgi:cell division septation protein DedD